MMTSNWKTRRERLTSCTSNGWRTKRNNNLKINRSSKTESKSIQKS